MACARRVADFGRMLDAGWTALGGATKESDAISGSLTRLHRIDHPRSLQVKMKSCPRNQIPERPASCGPFWYSAVVAG
jgi:hypothetical protein